MRGAAGIERRLRIVGALIALVLLGCGTERLDLPALPAILRGHEEVEVRPDGSLVPWAVDPAKPVGLCLEVPASTDTSRWEARLTVADRPSPAGFAPPAARAGGTVCFEGTLPPGLSTGETELCGKLVDRFDGSERRLPCRALRVGGDGGLRKELLGRLGTLVEGSADEPLPAFLGKLDALAAQARSSRLPLLEVRFTLVGAHFLTREGTPEALAEAGRRLGRLPRWLEREEASRSGALAAYQRAELDVARGELAAAWEAFGRAGRRYGRVADPNGFTVTMQQADLLSRAGAPREALERLRAALADCGARRPCDPVLLPYGRLQLAWLILLDPDASPAELAEAAASLESGLREIEDDGDPAESATHWINLAHLEVRRGRGPGPALARARGLLAGMASGAGPLAGWADLVEGLGALDTDPGRSLSLCAKASGATDPPLAARALSCVAEARRRQGDLAGADRAFAQALARHERSDARRIGLRLPLGPGQRADDYAHAARVAVERGDPGRAWDLLAALDRLSAHEEARQRCRERASSPSLRQRWDAIDAESAALQSELDGMDGPASSARRAEREAIRRGLQERLRALWREWPGCAEEAEAARGGDEGVRFRAVALEDEVLLLGRDAEGTVTVERRTPMPREELRKRVEEIGTALDRRDLDDAAWRRLAAPLAAALVPPDPQSLEEGVATFAVHGLLQGIPLGALPLEGSRWLGETVTVAFQPAGARAQAGEGGAPPLFVVDPLGDLPGASELLPFYRQSFPAARVIHREEAVREAFQRSLAGAEWLHLDTHGTFEPAFPELSSLELADGPVRLVQLAGFPMPRGFANLSGCETGRWPFTADSGRFGLGGLLARRGVGWVIASRTDLEDGLARDFNRAFYGSIRSGRSVPAAYREALAAVRSRHRAVSWAGLLLLRGAGVGGKTAASRLPSE